jgi:hypothetical protein
MPMFTGLALKLAGGKVTHLAVEQRVKTATLSSRIWDCDCLSRRLVGKLTAWQGSRIASEASGLMGLFHANKVCLVTIATDGGWLYKSLVSHRSCTVHFFIGKFKINVNLIFEYCPHLSSVIYWRFRYWHLTIRIRITGPPKVKLTLKKCAFRPDSTSYTDPSSGPVAVRF